MKKYDFHSHLGKTSSGEENSVEGLKKDLEKFGISKVAIISMSQFSMRENNDIIIDAMNKFPNFIEGIAFINPKSPIVYEEIDRCLGEHKMNGVKFMPWKHGYNVQNVRNLDKVVDAIGKYNVHIQIHGGASPLCTPFVWIDLAEKRPNIDFVFTHICGREFGISVIDKIKDIENIYVETSANMEAPILKKAVKELGSKRILFGTDWPYKPTNIEIEKLMYLGLSEDELKDVFYKNAEKLWNRRK